MLQIAVRNHRASHAVGIVKADAKLVGHGEDPVRASPTDPSDEEMAKLDEVIKKLAVQ